MHSKKPPKSSKVARKPVRSRTTSAKRPVNEEKPRNAQLLSGGNPQIPKADGDAAVQEYLAAMPGWKQDVGRRLDALISRTVPDVRKAVRWNSPFYGTGSSGWFLSFHCITKYIKVGFFSGSSLKPMSPVASKNEGTRYFHIHEGDWIDGGPLDEDLLSSWIKQAAKLPGWPGFKC